MTIGFRIVLIGSLKNKLHVNFPTGVLAKKIFSHFHRWRDNGVKLDAGVSDINTASTELMSVTGEEDFLGMNLVAQQQREGRTVTLCVDKKIYYTVTYRNGRRPSLMIPSEATNKPKEKA